MTDPSIDITIALEVDEDWPIADLLYDREHWASVTFDGNGLGVTIYGQSSTGRPVPLDAAIESLERAKKQLLDIVGRDPSAA